MGSLFRTRRHARISEPRIFDHAVAKRNCQEIISQWTDPCGATYEPKYSVHVNKNRNVAVEVSGVDEIEIEQFVEYELGSADKTGVRDIVIDFASGCLVFEFARNVTKAQQPAPPSSDAGESSSLGKRKSHSDPEGSFERIAGSRVDDDDLPLVRRVLRSVQAWDGDVVNMNMKAKLRETASSYNIMVTGLSKVRATQLGHHSGLINLKTRAIELCIARTNPDL